MAILKTFKLVKKIDITIVEENTMFNILPVMQLSKRFGIFSLDLRWGTFELSFHTPFNTNGVKKMIDRMEKDMKIKGQ